MHLSKVTSKEEKYIKIAFAMGKLLFREEEQILKLYKSISAAHTSPISMIYIICGVFDFITVPFPKYL